MKKAITVFILVFLCKSINAQNLLTEIIENGNTSHLNNLLTLEQINNFSKDELRILRNTIYAKQGYKFISKDLTDHFSQFSWYEGNEKSVERKLTPTDWKNIRLIKILEDYYYRFSFQNNGQENVFNINDFVKTGNLYESYDGSTNKKRIIFNKIVNRLYIKNLSENEFSEHMEKINNYMIFIGYNCKNPLINAFNESENTKWRRIFDDEWYANIVIMNAHITITNNGQITSRFFIYTYEDGRFAGRFYVDIDENKIIYPGYEYGRD
ncbi:MAG: YARHG domain-containing protein [Treponema sp.]|nr:YARHG domain-containing protein [Treponema sp.]